jgi:putative acetyltransferase
MQPQTEIRLERPEDVAAIHSVNDRAFGRPDEGALVDQLRANCDGLLSLVAVAGGRVVGHIMFSPTRLETDGGATLHGMGLAPLAVLPEHQKQGIGSELTRAGLAMLAATDCPFVIVLGHVDYYPRFGFERASARGIRCQWPGVPDAAFMVLIMDPPAMTGATGVARYRAEFDAVS